MRVHTIEAGPFQTKGYVISDDESRGAVIVDVPMQSLELFTKHLLSHKLELQYIVLTHGHFDHVGDVRALSASTNAPVLIHEEDATMLEKPASVLAGIDIDVPGMSAHRFLNDGEQLVCGSITMRVIHAPGHTRGHVVLHEAARGVLFAGDVLFHSSIGRTDLPGGDYETLMKSITERLLTLPDDTVVYPGHGPHTSIGFERGHNPFIREYFEHF